jgi:septum site-determining protein MinC
LRAQFEQSSSFFAGARLIVDVGERELSDAQLAEILALMEEHGLQPEALAASTRESRTAARAAGLRAQMTPVATPQAPPLTEHDAMLVVRTVRSGQVLRYQGHVVVIGDVNAGAEVIAGGSVVVWGRLRGLVHAGAFGKREALICALELRPTQLRIADLIARTPEDPRGYQPTPEVASIDQEQGGILVQSWDMVRREWLQTT